MNAQLTIYEKAITTDRPAERLAHKHGFDSVAQLAETLPPDAWVLDIGAGASPFGKEVAALRPDITWINFDYSYQDPSILEDITKDAPPNLEHVAGDATKLSETYEPETFDAVFSYWLLPHLSIDDEAPARKAAESIFGILKTGGLASVGPRSGRIDLPNGSRKKALHIVKDSSTSVATFTDEVVKETKLSPSSAYVQKLGNEVATPFFGTTRYIKQEGRVPKIYHSQSGEYVSPFTRKGVRTMGRLVVAMARHASNQRKTKR